MKRTRRAAGKTCLALGWTWISSCSWAPAPISVGEETALLESLEGKRGQPRLKPPFPATVGLYGCPTVINNVETLCNLPHIVAQGAEWYTSMGTERSPGPRLFSVSGHVNRRGVYELPMGVPLRELIFEHAGGIRHGHRFKAVIPGGSSVPVLGEQHLDVRMDFESLQQAGSPWDRRVIVMDETTCMVSAALNLLHFYWHESCGNARPAARAPDGLSNFTASKMVTAASRTSTSSSTCQITSKARPFVPLVTLR